jgi:hypothetical protein
MDQVLNQLRNVDVDATERHHLSDGTDKLVTCMEKDGQKTEDCFDNLFVSR